MLSRLYVFIHLNSEWVPCGLLEYAESGRLSSSIFRYGRKYLSRPDAISIDPIFLPLQDTTFSTPEGFSIFNGIRDAGPDKWGRYLLGKKFSRALNEIEYIAAASSDRVGALGFSTSLNISPGTFTEDESFHPPTKKTRLNINQCMGAVDDAVGTEETERLKEYLSYGPSLGGARPKATVEMDGSLYLAKFTLAMDKKDEALIEYGTMMLAKACGLNVPELRLEKIDNRSVYLIKRFDRNGDIRTPFISGLTMTGIHESDFSSWSYFTIANALVKFSARPDQDLRELFKRMLFNIAVFNNDDHLRNFGFLYAGKDRWNLSPLYDVVPTEINAESYFLAMTLGTQGKLASFSNALSMCERFRINKSEAKEMAEQVRSEVSNWAKYFAEIGVAAKDQAIVANSFTDKP